MYLLIIKDFSDEVIVNAHFRYIADAVEYFKTSSGNTTDLIDESTGEILASKCCSYVTWDTISVS